MILALHKPLNRLRKRFRKDDGGATAVEFAFVGGPFLFLLLATLETGMTVFTEHAIQSATTTASRLIRTGQAQNDGYSAGQFKEKLCANLPAMLDCGKIHMNVEIRNTFSDASSRADASNDGALNDSVTTGAAFNPGKAGDIVVVETFYEWQLFAPMFMGLLDLNGTTTPAPHWLANHGKDKRLVRGVAVFRNEPFD